MPDTDAMPAATAPIGPTDHLNTVEYWRDLYVTAVEVGQEAFTRIRELHQPTEEEAEFWFDADGPSSYCEPSCTDGTCPGHSVKMRVCRECGYEHDGETPVFRPWPCPTIRALDDRAENDGRR